MSELLDIVKDKLQQRFDGGLLAYELQYDIPVFIVKKDLIKEVLVFLKEDKELNFHFLTTLCGLHYPENLQDKEFGLMYQLHNMPKNWRVRIKTFMSREDMNVPTLTDVWKTANWMERQEYDFFGFNFIGHPNLRRILNMDEMNYFPMRKEYPLEDLQREDKNDKMFGR
ncbi:MAG: NADH-quinone oxidoreductase subunit C [Sphingobacteriales bacterium]|nr:NADH-quinone oxidoreductase subunit C [Sphingobacteriales bacterium]